MNGSDLPEDGSLLEPALFPAVAVVVLEATVAVWFELGGVVVGPLVEPPDPPPWLVGGGLQFASGSTY